MDKVIAVIATLAVLVLVGRGIAARSWPAIMAATLAMILLVVVAERMGYWPRGWQVR